MQPAGSIKIKAANSVKWTVFQTVFIAISNPLFLLIKARFLSPEEFAYLAIIMIFIGFFKTLEDTGISKAIIQRETISEEECSTVFFFNVFVSCIAGIVLFLLSGFIADFFALAQLAQFIKITSVIVILKGPTHLFRAFLQKDLFFKEISLIEITRQIVLIGAATVLLSLHFGVISIIYANIFSAATSAVLTVVMCYRREQISIKLRFNPVVLASFMKFGVTISIKEILTYLSKHLDEVLIGYFLHPEVLGVYYFGKNILERLRQLIWSSFGRLLFPILSKLQNNYLQLVIAYQKITKYIGMISIPVFIGIAITAPMFIPLVFGEQWIDSVVVFEIYSIALIFKVMTINTCTSLLYALNKPTVVLLVDILTNIMYFIALFIFASYGISAILIIYSVYVLCLAGALQYFVNNFLGSKFRDYLWSLKNTVFASLLMLFAVLAFQAVIENPLYQLIGSVILGVCVYSTFIFITEKKAVLDLKKILFS